LLLSRERAKFSRLWWKVKIAAGIAKAMSRTKFDLTTPPEEIEAVRSKNEFLEVPLKCAQDFLYCYYVFVIAEYALTYQNTTQNSHLEFMPIMIMRI
jgi:hypothetical protein